MQESRLYHVQDRPLLTTSCISVLDPAQKTFHYNPNIKMACPAGWPNMSIATQRLSDLMPDKNLEEPSSCITQCFTPHLCTGSACNTVSYAPAVMAGQDFSLFVMMIEG